MFRFCFACLWILFCSQLCLLDYASSATLRIQQPSLSSSPRTALPFAVPRLSTTPCCKSSPPLYESFTNRPSSKTNVHHYDGSNVDLGTAAGKLYRVGVMSVQDGGDSDLVSFTCFSFTTVLTFASSTPRPSKFLDPGTFGLEPDFFRSIGPQWIFMACSHFCMAMLSLHSSLCSRSAL